jgi:hypothetical protein
LYILQLEYIVFFLLFVQEFAQYFPHPAVLLLRLKQKWASMNGDENCCSLDESIGELSINFQQASIEAKSKNENVPAVRVRVRPPPSSTLYEFTSISESSFEPKPEPEQLQPIEPTSAAPVPAPLTGSQLAQQQRQQQADSERDKRRALAASLKKSNELQRLHRASVRSAQDQLSEQLENDEMKSLETQLDEQINQQQKYEQTKIFSKSLSKPFHSAALPVVPTNSNYSVNNAVSATNFTTANKDAVSNDQSTPVIQRKR